MHSPAVFIPAQLTITQLAEQRTNVHAVVFTQRHLPRRTWQMRLHDYLAIEIVHEVVHRLVK